MVEVAEQPKRSPMITAARMRLSEYERQDWVANIEYGWTVEDIKRPEFWANMAMFMKPYDHIEARSEDGSWIAYLIVTGTDRTWARVCVDRIVNLTTKDVSTSQAALGPKHRVEWKGPQHKFAVIRLADDAMIKREFQEKDQAITWMQEYERTQ